MGDGDIRDRWLRQALQRRTSSERTWVLWRDRGDVIRMEIAGSSMWVYWQGVRVHIEHNVHARELDFLVKDDLVRREVTMVHFFEF